MKKYASIIGGTGATGKALTQQLAASPLFAGATSLVRRKDPEAPSAIQQIEIDFENLPAYQNSIVGEVAFSCLGTTLKAAGSKEAQWKIDYTYQLEFAKLARAQGIDTFVLVSARMANPKSFNFYSQMKGKLEEAITALNFPKLVILRPNLLVRPHTDRRGELFAQKALSLLNRIGLLKSYRPLRVERLAEVMIQAATTAHSGVTIVEPVF